MNITPTLFGWQPCEFSDYQRAYALFGGSAMADPRMLAFLNSRLPVNTRFLANYDRQHHLRGAICLWNNSIIAGDKRYLQNALACNYPLNADELALPLKPGTRIILPWSTRFLSPLTEPHVYNTSHRLNARRQICLAHPLKRKTRLARKNALKRFIQAGAAFTRLVNSANSR